MAVLARRTRAILPEKTPVGVQVLAAANQSALAVALAAELQFIRAEGFIFSHVADEGWVDGCAGSLLRYRRKIGATNIQVFADIKKKHSAHAVTADVSIAETARAANFFLADGLIVTGSSTGQPASPTDLADVSRAAPGLPVFVGSGVTIDNLAQFSMANGLIIGTHFKQNGDWRNKLDEEKIQEFMTEAAKFK